MFSKPLLFHLFAVRGMFLETVCMTFKEQVGFMKMYVYYSKTMFFEVLGIPSSPLFLDALEVWIFDA